MTHLKTALYDPVLENEHTIGSLTLCSFGTDIVMMGTKINFIWAHLRSFLLLEQNLSLANKCAPMGTEVLTEKWNIFPSWEAKC